VVDGRVRTILDNSGPAEGKKNTGRGGHEREEKQGGGGQALPWPPLSQRKKANGRCELGERIWKLPRRKRYHQRVGPLIIAEWTGRGSEC